MRELRSAPQSGPFAATASDTGALVPVRPRSPARFHLGARVVLWARHLLTGIGALTLLAFIIGATPIPEMIGDVTGRIAASATSAQTDSQVKLQGDIATAQQKARVDAEARLQAWQIGLQGDLATLTAALEGVKAVIVQKATADLQARNMLFQTNAQLQADRVRQIMQIQEMLERGNIASAQVLDVVRNLAEALEIDASRLRKQSQGVKTEVLDQVTRVTPISPENGAGIMKPVETGTLDADIEGALAELHTRIAAMEKRFAIRPAPIEPRADNAP